MSAGRIVRGADLRPVPWRNGMGTTRDVATAPAGPTQWQVSIADLERDAPFSDFTGMDRTFTIIEGAGVVLAFGDVAVPCPPLVPVRFPGGAAPACRLRGGPGRAFNVLADAERVRAEATVLRLAPDTRLEIGAETTLVHCVDGALHVGGGRLGAGDTLVDARGPAWTGTHAATLIRVAIATRTGAAD